jgi:pyroglutamyl-peptidase
MFHIRGKKVSKRVLVTGFEPFDGDDVNPSMELLTWFENKNYDFELHTELLPVSFTHAVPKLNIVIESFKPTHVLLTGLAKNRKELTLERIGINWVDARIPDNDGVTLKAQKILPDGKDGIFTTLPLDVMMSAAKNVGCETKVSTSAGEYVCNYLIYRFLSDWKKTPGVFVHLPGVDDYELIFRGIEAIVKTI